MENLAERYQGIIETLPQPVKRVTISNCSHVGDKIHHRDTETRRFLLSAATHAIAGSVALRTDQLAASPTVNSYNYHTRRSFFSKTRFTFPVPFGWTIHPHPPALSRVGFFRRGRPHAAPGRPDARNAAWGNHGGCPYRSRWDAIRPKNLPLRDPISPISPRKMGEMGRPGGTRSACAARTPHPGSPAPCRGGGQGVG